jgi:hypothetical protein
LHFSYLVFIKNKNKTRRSRKAIIKIRIKLVQPKQRSLSVFRLGFVLGSKNKNKGQQIKQGNKNGSLDICSALARVLFHIQIRTTGKKRMQKLGVFTKLIFLIS